MSPDPTLSHKEKVWWAKVNFFGQHMLLRQCNLAMFWAATVKEWLPWLQTNWRDSGYGRFAFGIRDYNCKRKPTGQLPSSSYNHNAPTTHNPQNICERVYNKLAVRELQISVVRVFSVLWLYKMSWAASPWVSLSVYVTISHKEVRAQD